MNHLKSIQALYLVFIGLAMSIPAFANVGTVIYSIGVVNAEKPAIVKLGRGSQIEEGDVIVTGPKGYAQIKFADGSKIALRPDTRFVVEALEAPATATTPAIGAGKTLKASFNLEKGGFRTITGGIARRDPGSYQIATPSAVIRVRGTLYQTVAGPDGTYVGVSNGSVSMTNAGGTVNLAKNQYGFAGSFTAPPEKLIAPPPVLSDENTGVVADETTEESGGGESGGGGGESGGGGGESGGGGGESGGGGGASGGGGSGSASTAASRGGTVSRSVTSTVAAATTTTTTTLITPAGTSSTERPIEAVGQGGTTIDLNEADNLNSDGNLLSNPKGIAISVGNRALGFNTSGDTLTRDAIGNLTGFVEGANTFDNGDATNASPNNLNTGFDPVSKIRWGRWGGELATQTTGGTQTNIGGSGLHYALIDVEETIPAQVITGSADYALVGNTDPTDQTGATGVLGSASFNADFTNSTVSSTLQIGINNQNWTASGTGQITANLFNGLYSTVNVNGVSSATNTGSFGGAFGGFGASGGPAGVGMAYQLTNGTTVINGAAVFNNTGNTGSTQ